MLANSSLSFRSPRNLLVWNLLILLLIYPNRAISAPQEQIINYESESSTLTGTVDSSSQAFTLEFQNPNLGQIAFSATPGALTAVVNSVSIENDQLFETPESTLANRVFLSKLPGAVEVKVALRSKSVPAYSWSEDEQGFKLEIVGIDAAVAEMSPAKAGDEIEILDQKIETVQNPALTIVSAQRYLSSVQNAERGLTSPELPPEDLSSITQRLIGFEFLEEGEENKKILRISLSERAQFSMQQESDRAYSLLIPDAKLDSDRLSLPFFPPRDYLGLSYVTANQDGAQVLITVGVDRGISLIARPSGNQILIEPGN